ncbi:MAG: energy transducer TonB [Bryobacteraceae bacterium]
MQTFDQSPARPFSHALSLLIHGAAIALLLLATRYSSAPASDPPDRFVPSIPLHIPRILAREPGGGGTAQPLPPSRGQLPTVTRPFAMPPNPEARPAELMLPPSIEAVTPQTSTELRWGLPDGAPGPPSGGPGKRGGIGDGPNGAVGNSRGPGADRGGLEAYRVSGEVSGPKLIFKHEPEYSEDARKAKLQGAVQLEIVVGPDGLVHDIRVTYPLGLGLDEKAVEAVRQWRFKPGMKMGRPVAVRATVEVNFRLL